MTPSQAASDFLLAGSADTAAVLAYVPDVAKEAALLWCAVLLARAVLRAGMRRFLPGLDWNREWRGPKYGRHWSWTLDRRHRWAEVWAGRLYVCIDLPHWMHRPEGVPFQSVR